MANIIVQMQQDHHGDHNKYHEIKIIQRITHAHAFRVPSVDQSDHCQLGPPRDCQGLYLAKLRKGDLHWLRQLILVLD